MNDTAVITNDLDRLAERVERAATLVTSLRNRCSDLEKLGAATQQQLDDLNAKLQGQDAGAIVTELAALKKDQREWLNERRDVTARIEAISAKLERIE